MKEGGGGGVVEARVVEKGAVLRQAEQPRFRAARLRARRDGAELQKPETEIREHRREVGVCVEAGGEADGIGEFDPHNLDRQRRRLSAQQPANAGKAVERTQQGKGQMVAEFRVQPEQQLSEQGVQRCLSVVLRHRAYCTCARAPGEG